MRKSEIQHSPKHKTVDFHADVPYKTAPEILKVYNSHGEVWYKLKGGTTQSAASYKAMWKRAKEPIKPQNYRVKIDSLLVLSKTPE